MYNNKLIARRMQEIISEKQDYYRRELEILNNLDDKISQIDEQYDFGVDEYLDEDLALYLYHFQLFTYELNCKTGVFEDSEREEEFMSKYEGTTPEQQEC